MSLSKHKFSLENIEKLSASNIIPLISAIEPDELLEFYDYVIDNSDEYNKKDHYLLRDNLRRFPKNDTSIFQKRLEHNSDWQKTSLGKVIIAEALHLEKQNVEAIKVWHETADSIKECNAYANLALARLYRELDYFELAYLALKSSSTATNDYYTLTQIAKVLKKLVKKSPPLEITKIKLAILSTSTTSLILPILHAKAFSNNILLEIYESPYGNLKQDIMNPESGLYKFQPEFIILYCHWRDLKLSILTEDSDRIVTETVKEWKSYWDLLNGRLNCQILQHNFDLSATDSLGYIGHSNISGRTRTIRRINEELLLQKTQSVHIVDFDNIAANFGRLQWDELSNWLRAQQYPNTNALSDLCESYMSLIRSVLGASSKVLVLDLDNTLWGGVIGEDGLGGIKIGPPSPTGEAFSAFQEYILELKQRGIILAVCSKNNEADAKLPFEKHDGMVLKLNDFIVFKANWLDKATNLIEIAKEINVGIDSLVFVDDNPFECKLVRSKLPMVKVVQLPETPSEYIHGLHHGKFFESISLSNDDINRNKSYKSNIERQHHLDSSTSLEEYLDSLKMESSHDKFNELVMERVTQLINKTNQFNLTTRRRNIDEVRKLTESKKWWTQWFRLSDQFGDNGLIGIVICKIIDTCWEVDTLLMSCRVIGRTMEDFMLNTIIDAAIISGATEVRGIYIESAKNNLVADFYPSKGFILDDNNEINSESVSVHTLNIQYINRSKSHIEDKGI